MVELSFFYSSRLVFVNTWTVEPLFQPKRSLLTSATGYRMFQSQSL